MLRLPGMSYLMQVAIALIVPRHRIGVSLVVLNEQKQVLLLRHVFHPHLPWGLPGGWLNRHEDPAIGGLRELREETGLQAKLGPVLHISRNNHPPHLNIAYLAYPHPGPITLSGEILEAAWFSPDQLPPLFPFMYHAIATAVQQHPAPPIHSHVQTIPDHEQK